MKKEILIQIDDDDRAVYYVNADTDAETEKLVNLAAAIDAMLEVEHDVR